MSQLESFVIYGPNQVEYPGRHVTRKWIGMHPVRVAMLSESLDAARAFVPSSLNGFIPIHFARDEDDDPAIIETWL